jgi:hypothetical protein
MHFKTILTPKSRTPKQNAQEAQIPIIKVSAITAITITVTIVIIIIATIATKITIKKVKGKAKGRRALFLERWHKRLDYLNYADVKQLATYSS